MRFKAILISFLMIVVIQSCKKEERDLLPCNSNLNMLTVKGETIENILMKTGVAYNYSSFPAGYIECFNEDSSITTQLMFGQYPSSDATYSLVDHKFVDSWLFTYVHLIIGIKKNGVFTYYSGISDSSVDFIKTDKGLNVKWCDIELKESDVAGYIKENPNSMKSSGFLSSVDYQP